MTRLVCGVVSLLAGAVLLWGFSGVSEPQQVSAQAPKEAPKEGAGPKFKRTENFAGCLQCHEPGPAMANIDQTNTDLVTFYESARWKRDDLHSEAWNVLNSALGKRMTELLGEDVSKAARCLVCHGVDPDPSKPLSQKSLKDFLTVKPATETEDKHLAHGVSCEACHGNAEKWFQPHQLTKWRDENPHTGKFEQYGQVDLRNPAVKAAKCASCHVGNASEGKIVTHDMYAAGHPPLPSFELASFTRDEPGHYIMQSRTPYLVSLAESPLTVNKAFTNFHFDPKEIQSARTVSIGAIVSLREYLNTLATEAETTLKEGGSLDWTHFNCSACHHDLRYPSRRQQTGYLGVPGRLFPRTWSLVSTKAVTQHVASMATSKKFGPKSDEVLAHTGKFETAVNALFDAFDKKPFGSSKDVQKAASELAKWCTDLTVFLERKELYTPEESKALLAILRDFSDPKMQSFGKRTPFTDFDAAQNLLWAYSAIQAEVSTPEAERKRQVPAQINTTPKEWVRDLPFGWNDSPTGAEPILLELDKLVPRTVRPKERKLIQELSKGRSEMNSAFDPLPFKTIFAKLKTLSN